MYKAFRSVALFGLLAGAAVADDTPAEVSQQQQQAPDQTQAPSSQGSQQQGSQQIDQAAVDGGPKHSLEDALAPWLRIGASLRGRVEDGIISIPGNVNDTYYLDRMRLDMSLLPRKWLSFVTQIQDARVWGYDQGQPSGTMQDPLDLRQGYVQLGGRESNEPFIRFGRQEITYGNNRIIGDADWGNSAREFDAVRARYYHWGTNFEFVAGSVVLQDPNRFDRHKPGEHLYGTYETLDKLVPKAVIEPYLFGKTALNVIPEIGPHGNSTEYVSGLRFAGKLPAHVDYSLETVHEGGNYAGDRIAALGEVYTLGWTVMQSHWAPRISADYSYASGDSNPKDGVHGTFDQMYGNAQPFFSLTGLIGWKNIRDTREGVDFAPAKHVKIFVDYRDFNLATVKDGLYNGQGTRVFLNPNAASDHVGEGIDTKVSIEWPKAFTTSFGVGTLFAGAYLQELKQQNTYVYPYFTWAKRF